MRRPATLPEAQYRRALLGLVLLALVLRFIGLDWDSGRGLHPDEGNLVRAALALGVDGRLLPEFHAYNDFALWLPRLLALPFCDGGDATCLRLVARALSAVLSLALVPLGALVARAAAGPLAGLAAALALAVSAPLVQWAHFGTTESAMAALVLVLWALVARWHSGLLSERDLLVWSALALGIGFGFKTTALAMCVIPLTAIALDGRPDRERLVNLALFAGLSVFLAAAFAPSVWLKTADWLEVMRFEGAVVDGSLPVFWTAQFTGTGPLFNVVQLWSITAGAGVLLALAGVALAGRDWRILAPGLAFALVYAALTFGWHARFVRYLSPLVPVVLVLAGVGVARLMPYARSAAAAALAGLGFLALAGLDQSLVYLRPDPRLAAEAALVDLSSPGQRVAVEPFDLAQTGSLERVTIPLDQPAPEGIATALAQAEWLVIASRRNWEVLPRQPGAHPAICAYYGGLADGSLGYARLLRIDRPGLLGRLFAPDLSAEETRAVFDRPEVFVFRNIARLQAEALAAALAAPRDPASCAAPLLLRAWRLGP